MTTATWTQANAWWTVGLEHQAVCAALVSVRLGGVFLFAPVLSSPAISPRIKAGLVIALCVLVAPALAAADPTLPLSLGAVVGELSVGLLFGLSLALVAETVMFASALLGMEFSFSLVNLIDPVSQIETPVLGQMLGWLTTLVLLAAGLHRTLLRAVLRSFAVIPLGHATLHAASALHLAEVAATIFLGGVQLASPVLAAGLAVEVTVALVTRLAPSLTANSLSVPVKTGVSYVVLVASLALWPTFLERHFTALLNSAERLVVGG